LRAGVEQRRDALARGHFAGLVLAVYFGRAAARAQALFEALKLLDEAAHVGVAGEFGGWFGEGVHVM